MDVGADGVRAPNQDELRVVETLRVCADARADGCFVARRARRRTDRAIQLRRAETMKETSVH